MKRKIELWNEAGYILEQVGKGVLLTAAAEGKVNTMTIAWGTMGIQWKKPIFIAFVRESRYTKEFLDKNGEFTVNIPYGEYDKSILSICGTRSGRDIDKIQELGLTLEESETISVPGIRQLPLTLECKVIYRQDQDAKEIQPEDIARYYPQGDFHTAYYGQVLDAYIIED
jgi:flavin reductase (DIM6/NTAB) family NADH-FMN oxidoreductase RutF